MLSTAAVRQEELFELDAVRLKPFLKWAGGKYRVLDEILPRLPAGRRLVEPFAGSAAVSLNAPFAAALASDFNADLINLYLSIQNETARFISEAGALFGGAYNTREAFDGLRAEFNESADPFRRSVIVYTGANNTNVELVRPTWLNKGFDFAICVSTCLFCSPKGRWSSRPSHIHLCRILTAMRQKHPDGFEHVRSGIRQAYACADFEAARLEAQKIGIDELDGIRGGMTGDIAIVVAKWMFIEQDITYWTHSGRAKFFGMLRDEGLL